MTKRLLLLLCLLTSLAHAEERPDWASMFRGVPGTLVIARGESWDFYNEQRANQGFIPASTYKIPHSLIALRSGVLKDGHQVLPWDGVERQYPTWNRDQTLRTAMKFSAVPVYQAFARAIGEARMKEALVEIGYGNAQIGGGLDRFWLDGALRISAVQQVRFLQQLYSDTLPFDLAHQLVVKDAILTEANADYVLRAKTGYENGLKGYGDPSKPGVGWWVGWVERDSDVTFFALNIDIATPDQLALRQAIVRDVLTSEGVLPSPSLAE